jgi:hypothetical protein
MEVSKEMSYPFDVIFAWLRSHQNILGWAGLFSLTMMVATLLTVPLIIVLLPPRYLNEQKDRLSEIQSFWRWPYLVVKNMIGVLLVLAGLAMLVLPGQGLLTLAIGLGLMNIPGKRRLIRRIIGQPRVLRTINRWRAKAHKDPLDAPDDTAGD